MQSRLRSGMRGYLASAGLAVVVSLAVPGAPALAQAAPAYGVGEQPAQPPVNGIPQQPGAPAATTEAGPVRLARFSYVTGNVTWRADETAVWAAASINLPLRQGAEIWVGPNSRAEVQFDDGTLLRLGSGAIATLQTLYSDAEGEYTRIKLNSGLSSLRLLHDRSVFQIDTPLLIVKTNGRSKIRIGVADAVEVAVREGRAALEGGQGSFNLEAGQYLSVTGGDARYNSSALPPADSWDAWNVERDRVLDQGETLQQNYLPANIGVVASDLPYYGDWHNDYQYGYVWCPAHQLAGWRPYSAGRWTWVRPFGWTWVAAEPWGWAPYHYGTWASRPYGWAWVPGPAIQPWCPAVVHFVTYADQVVWVPLAPQEVHYPSFLSFGYGRRPAWSFYFSIGQTANYYPIYGGYCTPFAWNNAFVNNVTFNNVTNVYGAPQGYPPIGAFGGQRPLPAPGGGPIGASPLFIPINAQGPAGAMAVPLPAFGSGGSYRPLPPGAVTAFHHGRFGAAPAPLAGPAFVQAPAATPAFPAPVGRPGGGTSMPATFTQPASGQTGVMAAAPGRAGENRWHGFAEPRATPVPFDSAVAAAAARHTLAWRPATTPSPPAAPPSAPVQGGFTAAAMRPEPSRHWYLPASPVAPRGDAVPATARPAAPFAVQPIQPPEWGSQRALQWSPSVQNPPAAGSAAIYGWHNLRGPLRAAPRPVAVPPAMPSAVPAAAASPAAPAAARKDASSPSSPAGQPGSGRWNRGPR